ncbi:universal stress protein [Flammeovirgaceae bacterium SG7u.111]|nr:universal stress protein [Flammeovirgaceae bacterium SG7u.132]WPO36615.1 universal stress protein [Flammeovirgaceae bacterium SG7u.111]
MNTIKKILIPIDFNDSSKEAVKYGAAIAKASGASLYLLHAYSNMIESFVEADGSVNKQAFRNGLYTIKKEYNNMVEAIPELDEVTHHQLPIRGVSADVMITIIQEMKMDLLVMASRRFSGLQELMGTKRARTLLENTKVPLLLIPNGGKVKPVRKIAIAIDEETEVDKEVLEVLPKLAESFDAKLEIVNVHSYKGKPTKYIPAALSVEELLEDLQPDFFDYYHKSTEKGLTEYVKGNNVDIVTLFPRKKRSMIQKLFQESLTAEMVNKMEVPLLILR